MTGIDELKILTVCIWRVQLLLELGEHGGRKRAATFPDINQFFNSNLFRTDIREFIVRTTWGGKQPERVMM